MTGNSIFIFILDFIELIIDVCGENYKFQIAYIPYGYLVKIPELETAHVHHSNIMY